MANCKRHLKEGLVAIELYKVALTVVKNGSYIFNNIGLTYSNMSEYEISKQYFDQAIELALYFGNRGIFALNKIGKIEEGLKYFN